ncbi:MAG TPA: hypothetical protein VF039_02950 [Longimicrobiales bacterium]
MRNHILATASLALIGCAGGTEPPAAAGSAAPVAVTAAVAASEVPVPGEAEIRALIRDVYDVISGPAGQQRDWQRMRALFAPNARLSAMVPRMPPDSLAAGPRPLMVVMTVEDWIRNSEPFLMEEGFFETELHNEIERYGNVAHVWSTYDSRIGSPTSEPMDRGINSFQLVHHDGRWWVWNILWHSERAGAGTIPDRYLD